MILQQLKELKGLFNNYVTLKLLFFDPPTPYHHALSRMITRPSLRYVTPDTDNPLCHLSLFFEVEKKDTHSSTTSLFELFLHKESRVPFPADTAIASRLQASLWD